MHHMVHGKGGRGEVQLKEGTSLKGTLLLFQKTHNILHCTFLINEVYKHVHNVEEKEEKYFLVKSTTQTGLPCDLFSINWTRKWGVG